MSGVHHSSPQSFGALARSTAPRRVSPDQELYDRINNGKVSNQQLYIYAKQNSRSTISYAALSKLLHTKGADAERFIVKLFHDFQSDPERLARFLYAVPRVLNIPDTQQILKLCQHQNSHVALAAFSVLEGRNRSLAIQTAQKFLTGYSKEPQKVNRESAQLLFRCADLSLKTPSPQSRMEVKKLILRFSGAQNGFSEELAIRLTWNAGCKEELFEIAGKVNNPLIRFRAAKYLLDQKDIRGIEIAHTVLAAKKLRDYQEIDLYRGLIASGDRSSVPQVMRLISDKHLSSWTRADLVRSCVQSTLDFKQHLAVFESLLTSKEPELVGASLACLAKYKPSEDLFNKIVKSVEGTDTLRDVIQAVISNPSLSGMRWLRDNAEYGALNNRDRGLRISCIEALITISRREVLPEEICRLFVHPSETMSNLLGVLSQKRSGIIGSFTSILQQAQRYPNLADKASKRETQFLQALKLNIRSPYRYNDELMSEMIRNRMNPKPDGRPLAVVVMPRSDWNGAFSSERGGFLDQLRKAGYKLMVYEVSTDKGLAESVLNATQHQKFSLLVVGGHGSQSTLSFSESDPRFSRDLNLEKTFDIYDVDKLKKYNLNARAASNKAQAILWSCSAGKGKDNANNTANTLAKIFPSLSDIFAPTTPTNIKSVAFTADKRIASVKFSENADLYVKKAAPK